MNTDFKVTCPHCAWTDIATSSGPARFLFYGHVASAHPEELAKRIDGNDNGRISLR